MSLDITEHYALGVAVARVYIAAQGVSQVASDAACELIEKIGSNWANRGFNQQMAKTKYQVKAGMPDRD